MSRRDLGDFVLLAALWGASFMFMRVAAPAFGPYMLVLLRVGLAALCLWPLFLLQGGRPAQWRGHGGALLFQAMSNSAIPWTLFAYASLSLTAAFTSLLNTSTPLWAALVGLAWLRHRLSAAQVLGLLVGMLGMVVLTWGKVDFKPGGSGLAVLAGLTGACCYGVSTHHARRFLLDVPPLAVVTATQTLAAIVLLPLALTYWPTGAISLSAWISAIMMAVFATAVAMILYFRLIGCIGGQKAASVTFLIPVFAAGWGALLLGEGVSAQLLFGGVVILIGTGLTLGVIKWPKN